VDPANKPDQMAIDVPTMDGTLLHLTMNRDEAGHFSDDSPVAVEQHTANGLRPLVGYRANAFRHAAQWRPGKPSQLQLHDLEPGLTIEGHWLTTLSDWILMAAETDIDVWSREG
jgi:hypothetical protein